jgi:hypothetical protein
MMRKLAMVSVVLLLSSVCFAGEGTMRELRSKPLKYRVDLANAYILKVTGKRDMAEARALEKCMREATDDPKLYFMKVDEIAAACLVLMGY